MRYYLYIKPKTSLKHWVPDQLKAFADVAAFVKEGPKVP